MNSINAKLIRIIIGSILLTVIITTAFFIYFSQSALRNEAYRKLNDEAEYIEGMLSGREDNDDLRSVFTIHYFILNNPLISNRLILIDENKNYLPLVPNEDLNSLNTTIVNLISNELEETKNYISFSADGRENVGIAYRVRITTRTSVLTEEIRLGWLYLYVPLEEIELDTVILRVFLIALILSAMIGAAVSIFFSRKITRPLSQLSLYSRKISERRFDEVKQIKTGDEFESLSMDFINMADKLKRYDEKQREFFQNASHNLKTPLMSIKGYAEAILDGIAENKEKALNVIIDETDKLTELVKKILFISKSESVDEFYKFEEIALTDIIGDVAKKVKGIMSESDKKMETEVEPDLMLYADGEKLADAITNILANALRYADRKITVRAYRADQNIVISIEDDGAGFDEGEEEKVFERYYKGKKGNYGLGLYITKMIIEKHGGTIRAFNGDMGACFEIILKRRADVST